MAGNFESKIFAFRHLAVAYRVDNRPAVEVVDYDCYIVGCGESSTVDN